MYILMLGGKGLKPNTIRGTNGGTGGEGGRKGRAWILLHVQILEFFKCYLYFKQCLVQYITSNQIAMEFMQ